MSSGQLWSWSSVLPPTPGGHLHGPVAPPPLHREQVAPEDRRVDLGLLAGDPAAVEPCDRLAILRDGRGPGLRVVVPNLDGGHRRTFPSASYPSNHPSPW